MSPKKEKKEVTIEKEGSSTLQVGLLSSETARSAAKKKKGLKVGGKKPRRRGFSRKVLDVETSEIEGNRV